MATYIKDNPNTQGTNGQHDHDTSFEVEQETEDFLEATGELLAYAQEYINDRIEYAKLDVAEKAAKTTSSAITIVVLAVVGLMALLFGSVALALFLGEWLDSYPFGFLIVFGIYILVGVVLYFFKKQIITSPVLSAIITKMYE